MIGVSQANRVLQLVDVLQRRGAVEKLDKRTIGSRCYTNPFNNGNGAPYIFITGKGIVKFGHTLTGASLVAEDKITGIINGTWPRQTTPS